MSKMTDLSGNKYGRLTAIKPTFKDKRYAWECLCECGRHTIVLRNNLVTGRTRSCGCLASELTKIMNKTKEHRERLSKAMMGNHNGNSGGRRKIVKIHKEMKDE